MSGRYAKALIELADDADLLDKVKSDLEKIKEMIIMNDDLTRLIRSPVISREDQSNVFQELLRLTSVTELTRNFISVVALNRRLFVILDIIDDYFAILAGRRGELSADVTSAVVLSEIQQMKLLEILQSSVQGKISLNLKVDTNLLGGLIIKMGSRMIDSSLQTKLQQLKLAMRGIG